MGENPKMPEKEIIEKAKTMFNIQEETIKVPQDSKQGNSMKIYSKYAKFGTQELKDLAKSMDVDLDKDIEGGTWLRGIAGRTEGKITKMNCDGLTKEECKEKFKKILEDMTNRQTDAEATNIITSVNGKYEKTTINNDKVTKKALSKDEMEKLMKGKLGDASQMKGTMTTSSDEFKAEIKYLDKEKNKEITEVFTDSNAYKKRKQALQAEGKITGI